jgi:hypothetical protein
VGTVLYLKGRSFMDDLLLLAILHEIAKLRQRSDRAFLKALLSNLMGERLDESTFRNIASKLVEVRYGIVARYPFILSK